MAPIHETCLDNGLLVILKEVHNAPVTSIWMWYRVGSRNEIDGQTGLAHWVEHMMFKGSPHFPKGQIMMAVDRLGGHVNAMTTADYTAYYATLPSEHAELALRVEADRMVDAFFDPDEVETERSVIIAEREASENWPRFMLAEEVIASAFRLHPYRHQTVGWKEDLRAITRDQLYAFYRRHYQPNNAVLVGVGDLDPPSFMAMIERHLGALQPGDLPASTIHQEPPQRGERRVTLRLPGAAPLVRLSYRTPGVTHPDYMPLVVLDAVLSGGRAMFAFGDALARSARLYRALVETQLASAVGSHYHPSLDPYLLTMGATVQEGRGPAQVEDALKAEVARAQRESVTERELEVAIRQTQAQFAYSSESVTSQALTLGYLEMVDRYARMDEILGELARVTAQDVQRVADTYLTDDSLTAGWFLPLESGHDVADAPPPSDRSPPPEGVCLYSRERRGAIGPESVSRHRLANGVTLLVKENPSSSVVAVQGDILAGAIHDDADRLGTAVLTASMLRRGTQRHTYVDLNEALDNAGAELSISAGRDDMGFGGQALADDFCLLIDCLSEILLEPVFPEGELEKLRGQMLTHLSIMENDTGYRADRAFMEALYPPDHPYSRPVAGSREALRAATRDGLLRFYHEHYHPRTLVMSVVGAIEAHQVLDKVGATFGRWQAEGHPSSWNVPAADTPSQIISRRVHLPGKAQVDLIWGVVGLARTSPDYYAAMMANTILGQLGMMGRLGCQVRDDQGLAYYVSSNLHSARGAHPWSIVAGVHPDNVALAVESIVHEVERLCTQPVSDDELNDCRSFIVGSLPLHLETNEGIGAFLLAIEEYGLGLDYLERHPHLISSVTKQDIQRVAQQYLTLDRYVLSMSGTFA